MPRIIITVHKRHEEMLKRFAQNSGLSRSRIVRELFDTALRAGYTPGTPTLTEMTDTANRRLDGTGRYTST